MDQNSFQSYTDQKHLLLCPNCMKRIPDFLLKQTEKETNIQFQCSCTNINNSMNLRNYLNIISTSNSSDNKCIQHSRKSVLYCIECCYWLCKECQMSHGLYTKDHILLPNEINAICILHKAKYINYCCQCHLNICPDCLSNHNEHPITIIEQIDLVSIYLKNYCTMDSLLYNKKKLINKFIASIQKDIDDITTKLNSLNQLKENIMILYKDYQSINDQLKKFYECLYLTALDLKNYPNHQIIKLFKSIEIKENDLIYHIENNNYENIFLQIKDDLRNNFIIYQKESRNECAVTLTKYTNAVRCLALLPNDEIASGLYDETIKIWSKTTLKCTATLYGHCNSVNSLLYLKNQDKLVSCSSDMTCKIWDLSAKICVRTLTGHEGYVWNIKQLNNGDLASCSSDKTIKIWNMKTFLCTQTLKEHDNFAKCIIQLENGNLASGGFDSMIFIWSLDTNKSIHKLGGHKNVVRCILQLNNGQLASGSWDKTIKLWDLNTYLCTTTINAHMNYVLCLFQLKNGDIASGSEDKSIIIRNPKTYAIKSYLIGHSNSIQDIIELNDGHLVSCSWDHTIKLWDI